MPRWGKEFQRFSKSFPRVTDGQWGQLEQFAEHIYDWNSKVNLVSRKDVDNLVENHLVPCMSIGLLRPFRNSETIVDVGSGAGLPGIPLAIMFPKAKFTLMDGSSKKCKILEEAVDKLKLENVDVVDCRSNEFKRDRFDFLLGRGVSSIPEFLVSSSHLVKRPLTRKFYHPRTVTSGLLYLKGGDYRSELEHASIQSYARTVVKSLVPKLAENDKSILHIPTLEVRKFLTWKRKLQEQQRIQHKKGNSSSVHPPRVF